jgi:hypothetical protein
MYAAGSAVSGSCVDDEMRNACACACTEECADKCPYDAENDADSDDICETMSCELGRPS